MNNPQIYAQAIQQARNGDESAQRFLRLRLKSLADSIPGELLINLSEMVLDFHRHELRDQASRN